jgi:hypothetical protein
MPAEILTLSCEGRLDRAWCEFREHASRAVAEPRLLLDREFFNKYARLEDRYKRLLLVQDRRL